MYYCLRCRKYHSSGRIARSHTIYAQKRKKPAPKPRPKLAQKLAPKFKPKPAPQKPVKAEIKIIKKHKPKPKGKPPVVEKMPLRPSKMGYSKKRKAQLAMQITDPHERKMIERIMRKSGMTYIQAVQLFKKSKEQDIDIEHKIDYSLSKERKETYEFASKQLEKEKHPLKRSIKELYAEQQMYGF